MKGVLIYVPGGGERTVFTFIDYVSVVYLTPFTASNTIFWVPFGLPPFSSTNTSAKKANRPGLRTQPQGTDPPPILPSIGFPPTDVLGLLLSLFSPIPGVPDTLQGPASLFSSPWPPRCRPGLPNRPQPRTVCAATLRGGGRAAGLRGLAALTHWLALGQKVYRATWPVRSAMLVM